MLKHCNLYNKKLYENIFNELIVTPKSCSRLKLLIFKKYMICIYLLFGI